MHEVLIKVLFIGAKLFDINWVLKTFEIDSNPKYAAASLVSATSVDTNGGRIRCLDDRDYQMVIFTLQLRLSLWIFQLKKKKEIVHLS